MSHSPKNYKANEIEASERCKASRKIAQTLIMVYFLFESSLDIFLFSVL